ncbi:MAG: ComF family protein [Marinobacter sp.]|nr:ComF family protein [Marinobacter sp.]
MIMPATLLSTSLQSLVNRARGRLRYRGGLCVNCLAPNATDGLCQGCREDLPANRWHCHTCALPLPFASAGQRCGECLRNPPPFVRSIAPWRYQFPVDRMISRYKYHGQTAFARPLLRLFCAQLDELMADSPTPDVIIPAPMDGQRQRRRGFNQAEDIAREAGRATGVPVNTDLVLRTRAVNTQRGLSRRERMANLAGVFSARTDIPARVAIVDDVVTTGATTRQLARVLREAGAQEIQVWALARTP